jgi:hypothetical protein
MSKTLFYPHGTTLYAFLLPCSYILISGSPAAHGCFNNVAAVPRSSGTHRSIDLRKSRNNSTSTPSSLLCRVMGVISAPLHVPITSYQCNSIKCWRVSYYLPCSSKYEEGNAWRCKNSVGGGPRYVIIISRHPRSVWLPNMCSEKRNSQIYSSVSTKRSPD